MATLRRLATTRNLLRAAGVGIICVAFALALTYRPSIAPIDPPNPGSFTEAEVARGAVLATLGDCAVCHTAPGGSPLAGARALATPFGTLYSNNLTPDIQTGIGTWSKVAFRRAMRDGVARDGSHLYPALPYEHFTHVADADLDAIYAFLMTRRPVHQAAPPNKLIFPTGFRPILAGWKMMFLHKEPISNDPTRTDEWNRGAYLVEGLGHCGGCHTPRNIAGGEIGSHAYSGGVAEGWRAPALDSSNPAVRAWTTAALYRYLRTGVSPNHGVAAGPMGPVVEGLSKAPEADVRAIATYIASKMAGRSGRMPVSHFPSNSQRDAASSFPEGATLFAGACAGCHAPGAPMLGQGRASLSYNSALRDSEPVSAVQAILQGIEPPVEGRGPKMPSFASNLTDQQIAQVANYARARFTDQKPWRDLERDVAQARKDGAKP
ncbi:c-type cytochrome [Sphingobium sp. BHU LFT2]|uniref:c-type cytochrome n=1 Tax=Sphingobium sp. BHU LFT2 TaxID=2807634 RepID=UPI001BE5BE31|nr:c-type cytochrome [Sphingobium sp. BHU LFT2]MBT2246276.1 c-type cytochrome [Sphingobium sp. BHU LFT2]